MNEIRIAGRTIGRNQPCFIIAEIGTAHNGSLQTAEALVKAAAEAGADCVKTQIVYADEIVHPACGAIDLPGGKIALYEQFTRLERDTAFYRALKACTEAAGLVFLASAFGVKSARLLKELDVTAVKIASPELNHFPLLDEVKGYGVPVVFSTGVSRLGDIEEALDHAPEDAALLHCVTAYPAPEEEYNLRVIPLLSRLFGLPVGVSDHSLEPCLVPTAACAMGAAIIEKHLTLDRGGPGLDDAVALDPKNFKSLVWAVRRAEVKGPDKALRNLAQVYGRERVERVLGDGRKRLAPAESPHYASTRRSILAVRDIAAGEPVTPENTALLRSEKNLSPGLHPRFLPVILGRPVRRAVSSGTGLSWDDF